MTSSNERIALGNRVSIYQRGKKGTWVADFWHAGKHTRKSMRTPNKKVALDRATKLAGELHDGSYVLEKRTPIKEAVEAYLDHLRARERAAKTLTRYRGELETFAEFVAGRRVRTMDLVTQRHLDAFQIERIEDHAPKTVYHELVVIKQLFKWSHRRGLIASNPLADYELGKPRAKEKPVLTLDQVDAVLDQSSARKRRMIATLAFTGMRVSSLQALRRVDVDLRDGWMRVEDIKKRQSYDLPIHPRLAALLTGEPDEGHELLFTARPSRKYPEGGRPINPKHLNEYFQAAAGRAGIDGFTQHDLRHFFKSFTINHGVPERAVDQWLNHADGSVRERYYHLRPEESKQFMNSVPFGGKGEIETPAGG